MIPLPTFDLTGLGVGATGTILLKNAGISANPALTQNKPVLHLYNESGCGLLIALPTSGDGIYLPAGGWVKIPLNPGESRVDFSVIYVLPSPPVSQLLATYFAPGEIDPDIPRLGNSPIGIGGSVSVTSISQLSNEGSAIGTLIIDFGPLGNTNIVQFWNDHFTWSVVQSGVAHTVLQGQTSGNPLLVGKAGDISEVLGQFLVDQLAHFLGNILMENNTAIQAKNVGGTARDILLVDNNNPSNTIIKIADSSPAVFAVETNTGTVLVSIDNSGNVIVNNAAAFQGKETGGTARSLLYVGGSNQTCLQQAGNATKIFFRNNSAANLASIDTSGNMILKGTLTQNGTP